MKPRSMRSLTIRDEEELNLQHLREISRRTEPKEPPQWPPSMEEIAWAQLDKVPF